MKKTLTFKLKIDKDNAEKLACDYLILAEQIGEKERPYITGVSCEHGAIMAQFDVEISEEVDN